MNGVRDSFLDLDRQRQKLEGQASQLRKSLGYWRSWDADYETLKEELKAIPEASRSSPEALLALKQTVESNIVTSKELDVIFGTGDEPKSYSQIRSTLDGRIDTGSKNVASLERGLETTENKIAGIQVIMNPEVEVEGEDGTPITDIVEELDDDDNVISYRLQKPGDNTQQIRELLQKAGVQDIPEGDLQKALEGLVAETVNANGPTEPSKPASSASTTQSDPASTSTYTNTKPRAKLLPSEKQKKLEKKTTESKSSEKPKTAGKPTNGSSKPTDKPAPAPKKALAPEISNTSTPTKPTEPISHAAQRVQNIMETANSQEEISKQPAVIPDGESEEDARMRSDMLKYGLGEVGAVVAEMFIDDENDWTDEDEDYESDESDEFGQSKYSVITDDYRQYMLQLEKKLGFQSRFTRQLEKQIAALPDDEEEKPGDEGIGRIVVQTQNSSTKPTLANDISTASIESTTASTEEAPTTPTTPTKPGPKSNLKKVNTPTSTTASPDASEISPRSARKSVHFAEMLDIAPRRPGEKSKSNVRAKIPRLDDPPVAEPHGDVVERKPGNNRNSRKKKGKMSSFRKALTANSGALAPGPAMTPDQIPAPFSLDENKVQGASAPAPPEGETLAATVVERKTSKEEVVISDEIDEWQLQNEVADEYHKRRNKMIQQHGGFVKEEEVHFERIEENLSQKIMSRFKAARLSKQ